MIWILLFLAIIRPSPLIAQTDPIRLAKFKAINSSGDWVQIYNSSSSPVDLTGYKITDSSTNFKNLSCSLAGNSYYQIEFDDNLNNAGDTIFLKKSDSIIDSIQYCNHNCSPDTAAIDIYQSSCTNFDESTAKWVNLANNIECPSLSNNSCLAPTNTPIPPSTPTSTPTPAPTSSPNSTPSVSITISNSSLKIGQEYTLNFNISNPVSGHNYYLKAFGGTNNSGIETHNGTDWLSYTSSWSSFPQYPAKTSLNFRFKSDETTGPKNIYLRIKDSTSDADFESQSIPINLTVADPTATSSPKPSPSPSISPWPSEALAKEAEPTAILEPLPTDGLFLDPTEPPGLVAGLSTSADITISPTPSAKKNISNDLIPIALITIGGLFLTAPLIISKIKPA